MKGVSKTIVFFLYLVLGLYFINYPFGFVTIPDEIIGADKWIILVGGFFMILGAINFLKAGKKV